MARRECAMAALLPAERIGGLASLQPALACGRCPLRGSFASPRRAARLRRMSAMPSIATNLCVATNRHHVPCVDGSELARAFFRFAALVGAAMCSALDAVHMTAGHNALRGSGPGQKPAFDNNAMVQVVVLIAGSTGSALRAVRPPNLHITPRPFGRAYWRARWQRPWSGVRWRAGFDANQAWR